ncbi:MAG: vitamin K epoxide reductase family protein [Chloroflexi bacterium]|nr:vitamin K epoxide reductase family protein [Chloroflexota bacterium]
MAHGARRRARERHLLSQHPAWIPAAIGLLISLYLLIVDATGGATVCLSGTDCDFVRGSTYGHVLGIPLAAFGVVFFALTLALALVRRPWRTRWLAIAAGIALGASAVFIALQIVVLHAICAYCIAAEVAACAVAALVLGKADLSQWLPAGAGAVVAVAFLLSGYSAAPQPAVASEYARGLAEHLSDSGAKFYGAYWCPHCQQQKALFGPASALLPYVECDPRGQDAHPDQCQAAGVVAYPTWVIDGQKVEGTQSLAQLAQLSGYPPPPENGS